MITALDAAGYALEGYAKFFPVQAQVPSTEDRENESLDSPSRQSGRTNGQIVKTIGQNGGTEGQNGATKRQIDASERHGVATIAETIAKTTTETIPEISSPSCPTTTGLETTTMVEEDPGKLDSIFARMGLEHLRHQEAAQWLKDLIADLWRTRRIGKEQVPENAIREALSGLTPQMLDSLLDRMYWQKEKEVIPLPDKYMQRAILNETRHAAFAQMSQQGNSSSGFAPTYDMQEYTDLSMKRLLSGI